MDLSRCNRIIDLREEDGKNWNQALIREIYCDETAKVILNIPQPSYLVVDHLFWHSNNQGIFLVSNCNEVNCSSEVLNNGICDKL